MVLIKNLHSFYKRKRDESGEGEGEGEEGADPFDGPPVFQLGDLGQQRQEQEAAASWLDELFIFSLFFLNSSPYNLAHPPPLLKWMGSYSYYLSCRLCVVVLAGYKKPCKT